MKHTNLVKSLAFLVLLTGVSSAAQAEEPVVSLSIGYDQSTGDYGTDETTDIRFVPVTGQIENGPWTLKAVASWIEVDGAGIPLDGGGTLPGTGTGNSGPGDTYVSLGYLIYPWFEGGPFFEVTGKVKIPTADEAKDLGTGEIDYTGTLSLFQKLGAATLFADAGYRWRGSPELYDLEDGFVGSVGASLKVSEKVSAGVMYSYREAATASVDDPMDIMPFITFKFADDWSVNTYGTFGLSDSSPETGFGISLKRKFR